MRDLLSWEQDQQARCLLLNHPGHLKITYLN